MRCAHPDVWSTHASVDRTLAITVLEIVIWKISSERKPQEEGETDSDDQAQDDRVTSLSKVDLLHKTIDHGEPG